MSVMLGSSGITNHSSALLIRLTGLERARLADGWYHPDDLAHGQPVEEISYFGRYPVRPGDQLEIGSPGSAQQVEVIDLRLVIVEKLNREEIAALGYANLHQYEVATGRPLPARAWYMTFAPADPAHESAPAGADVLDDVLTAQEAAALYGLSESTVRVNIHRGSIPARKSGGTWLIRRADAERRWKAP